MAVGVVKEGKGEKSEQEETVILTAFFPCLIKSSDI